MLRGCVRDSSGSWKRGEKRKERNLLSSTLIVILSSDTQSRGSSLTIGVHNMLMRMPSIMIHLLSYSDSHTRLATSELQVGKASKQTIFHHFLHFLPRREGTSGCVAQRGRATRTGNNINSEPLWGFANRTRSINHCAWQNWFHQFWLEVATREPRSATREFYPFIHSLPVCCFAPNCDNTQPLTLFSYFTTCLGPSFRLPLNQQPKAWAPLASQKQASRNLRLPEAELAKLVGESVSQPR